MAAARLDHMPASSTPKRRWAVAAVVVIGTLVSVALLVVLIVRSRAARSNPGFETVVVDRGPIQAKVTATGTLSALVTVQVGSQVSGRVQQLFVDFNDRVRKGEVLAKLDPQLYEAALEQARANELVSESNLVKARAQEADAQTTLRRSQRLAQQSLIAAVDLQAAQVAAQVADANVATAKSQIALAKASLHQAQVNLEYTTIHSPVDGVVVSRNVDVGQTVAAALQSPTLFVIAEDLRKMQVDTSVSEADVGHLAPGMTATFRVDAYPRRTFSGQVRQIRNAAQTVQNVVTYDAVIDVDNADLLLRPGMTANVVFLSEYLADVTRVPNAALRFMLDPALQARLHVKPAVDEKDPVKKNVWVLRRTGPVAVAIVPGITDGTFTAVEQGALRPGDAVIVDARSNAKKSGFHIL